MKNILGLDCDGREIYEYRILRAIWANDIDIEELECDPRQYCAIIGSDGNSYAISVYDWWYKNLIRKYENLEKDQDIPIIIKPISEMVNYECAVDSYNNEFYYDLNREELKNKLNKYITKVKQLKK